MSRTVIYSRVSTQSQTTDNQLNQLRSLYPMAEVIEETASGGKLRPQLNQLVDSLEKGDVLVVASLDRLGRKTVEILNLIEALEDRGVVLKSLREGVDYSTVAGRLVTQILVSVSELERGLISSRTKAALDARRKKGIIGGRPRKYSETKVKEVRSLRREGMSIRAIAKETGISPARVHRLIHD
jgi:putative DNA-invertase from lambdoid prophage Rac